MGLSALQVTKSWVEPGRGFCKCSGGFGPSFGPCAGEEKEGVGPCFCSSVSTQSLESTCLCMWHYITLMQDSVCDTVLH